MAITRFVNAASTGGDGTTNALTGSAAAYASLSACEAAEQGDLSSIGKITVKCEGTTNDTTNVVIAGSTNASATNYWQIEASADGIHNGTADSGYVLAVSSGHAIENDVPYSRIGRAGFGIDIKSTSTTSSDEGIRFDLSAADLETCYVVGNIIRSTTSTSSKDGIYCNPSGGTSAITLNAFANIIYGWNRGGIHAQNYSGTNTMLVNAIQNTCHGNGNGVSDTGDILGRNTASGTTTIDSFNNICASTTSFRDQSAANTIWTGSHNVTADGAFNRGSMTSGSQATDGVTTTTQASGAYIIFTNITGGSEDYQLLDDSAGNLPVDFGTDKTATVPDDALGNAYATTPDNGAFELQAAGGITVNLTGQASTSAQGTVTATGSSSTALTGQSSTSSQGSLLVSISVTQALSGQESTLSQGAVVAIGASLTTLTGQSSTVGQGSITVDTSITTALTGQATAAGQGSITVTLGAGAELAGQVSTVSQGALSISGGASVALTGQELTPAQGTLTISGASSFSLSGQEATAAQGAISTVIDTVVALTGQSITASQGTIGLQTANILTLTGQESSSAQGLITISGGGWTIQPDISSAWDEKIDSSTTWVIQ